MIALYRLHKGNMLAAILIAITAFGFASLASASSSIVYAAKAKPDAVPSRVVADLSTSTISITTSFHGTDLLLFGAIDGQDGDDLIVVVSGPPLDIAQRRKANHAGIWVNVETNIWQQAPSFYQILSTRPLAKIAQPQTYEKLGIGSQNINLKIVAKSPVTGEKPPQAIDFIGALQSNMAASKLWPQSNEPINLTRNALFRTEVKLPANVLSGTYDVRILQFRQGQEIGEDRTTLRIEKGGMSALIYNFAHDYSALYGIFAILFAVASGWLAAVAFRRG